MITPDPIAPNDATASGQQAGLHAELRRLYPDLDDSVFLHLEREFEQIELAGGDVLVREGDPSDALYLLLNGRLQAFREGHAAGAAMGEIGRGEMIGEMSLFDSVGRRTATVRALRDSRLLRISNQAFVAFMQRHPSVTRQFIQLLMRRMSARHASRTQAVSTVAVVPAASLPASEMEAFWHDLIATLGADTSLFPVRRREAEAQFPGCVGTPDETGLTAWLNDQEQEHRLVLYQASPHDDAWTRLCSRQADCILLVADIAASPRPGAVESLLEAQGRRYELLLLRDPAARPQGTADWLALRPLNRHHHLRRGKAEDMQRLARHLLGRSIGLALGGGGARAFAEIGVLRALEDAGIPIDVIGGTSMGAVIGALAAAGEDADAILDRMRAALHFKPFSGLTLPLLSLLSGEPLTAMLNALFADQRIEDLPLRYLCVSSNLSRGESYVPDAGPLALWLRASNAVPGVVPPVILDGELFVDGGLINNIPADIVASKTSGVVIAVNVSDQAMLRTRAPNGTPLSGWRLLASGHRKDVPSLPQLIVRSMLLASANHAATVHEHAALHIVPELPGYDVSDWNALDPLVAAGYAHAVQALETWVKSGSVWEP